MKLARLSLLALLTFATPALAAPRATVDTGMLEGKAEGGVTQFLGVPFAAPPVGPLRWRAPQLAAAWTGVRAATDYAADCMQRPLDYVPGPGYIRPVSEDCLYLNVWRPQAASAKPLAVMVWIYGGSYTMGSGNWPQYNGANLARQGVIVVALNYRVGRFGFFAHPALTREAAGPLANYGLLDQMAALKWVRRNIAAFGGDPANVTVFGESAGAASINALLASPMAAGLFDKAISQSGGGQKGIGITPDNGLAAAEARGTAWTRTLGLADDDAAGLRAIPAVEVMGPQKPRPSASLIVDGKIIPRPVDEAFLAGQQAKVPYMVGANSFEHSLLQWRPQAADGAFDAMGAERGEAMKLYMAAGADEKTARNTLWGDALMVGPARYLARRMSASGAPVWLYHYGYVPVATRGAVTGAGHSAEISLVFHNEITGPYFGETAADSPMAATISGYWVRFAKTGDPNGGAPKGEAAWPRYEAASDRLLNFTNDGVAVEIRFAKAKLDLIDRAYLARAGLAEK